jgi:predicted membrane protein DUF2142
VTATMAFPRASRPLPPWLLALLVFAWLACWALLRPPLQSPDEPQHLLKASSVRLQPWFNAVADRFVPDRRYASPLALETPALLDKLFFKPFNALAISEIDVLRASPWYAPDGPPLAPYQKAIATYPQVYYWAVFAAAEPVVRTLGLGPWDATYVYRLASCAIVAALWGLVWHAARPPLVDAGDRAAIVALLLLTPMFAFISSAINPDAVNAPLCALAIVGAWRILTEGRGQAAFAASLFAAAMTKPSGLQLAAVLGAVAAGLAVAGTVERRRAAIVCGLAVAACVAAFAVFYAWQPPRFLAGGPSADTLGVYLTKRWDSAAYVWQSFWGRLGWLEYTAPAGWHWLVFALVLANLGCLVWQPKAPVRLAWYLGMVWIVFFVSAFAAEYRYLAQAGYTFQGRYLFPAGIGLGALLLHRVRPARVALLAGVVVLNVVLVRETVRRYYVDGWRGAVHALPFR